MKALLVDDHSLFRHGLEMLLKMRLQFSEVVHAQNAQEALAALNLHGDIDIVALDLHLGDDNGLQLMAQIKSSWPTLPVIMISGESDVKQILTALGEGAAGFVPKTLNPSELAGAVAEVIAGKVYVPPLPAQAEHALVLAAAKKVQAQRMADLEEVARAVASEHDLAHRVEVGDEQLVSALSNLLDELAQERQSLSNLAFTDELTGIANRRCFVDRAEAELSRCRRSGEACALLYMDVDEFKNLNDSWGHDVGDLALQHVAKVLQKQLREVDVAARLGGDEFTAVLHSPAELEGLQLLLTRLHTALTEPVQLTAECFWQPRISIGASLSVGDERLTQALRRADAALYKVKGAGKNSFSIAPARGARAMH
ncbi:GGDEF domain-containing protein [Agaribacterium haliotis]|uniref:GGDEF domain-containing protein n=1 Tax=Agaribacterium haliotis TaxID=2013869 RepID=UPI000BB533F6|nr:diguanylate cyclase [Agaribacterium haliotis]